MARLQDEPVMQHYKESFGKMEASYQLLGRWSKICRILGRSMLGRWSSKYSLYKELQ